MGYAACDTCATVSNYKASIFNCFRDLESLFILCAFLEYDKSPMFYDWYLFIYYNDHN